MSRYLYIILIGIFILTSCSDNEYTIKGELVHADYDYALILAKGINGTSDTIARTKIEDHKFLFKGVVNNPDMVYLAFEGQRRPAGLFFLESGETKLKAKWNSRFFDLGVKSELYSKIVDVVNDNPTILKIEEEIKNKKNLIKSLGGEDREKLNSQISDCYKNLDVSLKKLTQEVIDNTESPEEKLMAIAYANRERFFGTDIKEVLKIESEIGETRTSRRLKLFIDIETLQKKLEKARAKGSVVPDFSVFNKNGQEVKLYDVLKKNKYVLVDFWASWCGFCRQEFPALRELYKDYNKKGFEVFAISVDRNETAWDKALKEENTPWINLHDKKGISRSLFGIRYLPTSFLLNSEGKVVSTSTHGSKFEELVRTLLPD